MNNQLCDQSFDSGSESHLMMSFKTLNELNYVEDMEDMEDQTIFSSDETLPAEESDISCMESIIFEEEIDEKHSSGSESSVTFYVNGLNEERHSLEERLNSPVVKTEFDITHLRLRSSTGLDEDLGEFPRILFVGNLCPQINEKVLEGMFATFGEVNRVVLYNDISSTYPYAYIQFNEHESARTARLNINGIYWLGRKLKVCWVFDFEKNYTEFNDNNSFIVFVDNLSIYTEEKDLRQAFEPFGHLLSCNIAKNIETNLSKGFGFIHFVRKNEALNAINTMNGPLIHCSLISEKGLYLGEMSSEQLDFDSVYCESSESNRTVCCNGLQTRLCIQVIRILFSPFGCIKDCHIIEEKGCALISYESKRSAAQAIVSAHKMKIMGQSLSCWWAEEECIEYNDNIENEKHIH